MSYQLFHDTQQNNTQISRILIKHYYITNVIHLHPSGINEIILFLTYTDARNYSVYREIYYMEIVHIICLVIKPNKTNVY